MDELKERGALVEKHVYLVRCRWVSAALASSTKSIVVLARSTAKRNGAGKGSLIGAHCTDAGFEAVLGGDEGCTLLYDIAPPPSHFVSRRPHPPPRPTLCVLIPFTVLCLAAANGKGQRVLVSARPFQGNGPTRSEGEPRPVRRGGQVVVAVGSSGLLLYVCVSPFR